MPLLRWCHPGWLYHRHVSNISPDLRNLLQQTTHHDSTATAGRDDERGNRRPHPDASWKGMLSVCHRPSFANPLATTPTSRSHPPTSFEQRKPITGFVFAPTRQSLDMSCPQRSCHVDAYCLRLIDYICCTWLYGAVSQRLHAHRYLVHEATLASAYQRPKGLFVSIRPSPVQAHILAISDGRKNHRAQKQ